MKTLLVGSLLFLVAALVGCGSGADGATDADPWALTVFSHGGLCPDGECTLLVAVTDAGAFSSAPRFGEAVVGTIDPELVQRLNTAAAAADFDAIRAVPFEGTCPLAFDGMEDVYTFHVDGVEEKVASCESAIDETADLWQGVAAVVAAVQQAVDR